MVGPPELPTAAVKRRFQTQRTKDTGAELAVRRSLHAAGLRYWVHRRPVPELRVLADIVFPRQRVAVFIDGCFWHGCPEHFVPPKKNAKWWAEKIKANRDRDARSRASLMELGWTVVAVWEHADASDAANEIAQTVESMR